MPDNGFKTPKGHNEAYFLYTVDTRYYDIMRNYVTHFPTICIVILSVGHWTTHYICRIH